MAKHSITAVFDKRSHAEQAAADLRSFGVLSYDITLLPDAAAGAGFWGSLEQLFGGPEDHATYAESIRRGGVMLSVRADDDRLDNVIDILERHGSVDLDEREASWRSEGWTSGTAGTGTGVSVATTVGSAATAPGAMIVTTEMRTTAAPPVSAVSTGKHDVLQVIEERLNVGKRAVSRGKVRLHSYVVENQLSEDVTLRDETVIIDRHAVDRPVAALGEDAFRERIIEMEEIDEEAVVSKTARVVEEIGVRKEASDRVETVRGTVRSTKVDVEDTRTGGTAVGAAGRFAAEIRDGLDVVGSDGAQVGTVEHMDGERIKLKTADAASGGVHHYLTQEMVGSVAGRVILAVTAAEAKSRLGLSNEAPRSAASFGVAPHDEPIFDFAAEAKRLDVALGRPVSREDAVRTLERIAADASDIFAKHSEALSFLTATPLDEEGRDGIALLMERGLPSVISRLDDIRFGFQG